MFLCVLLPRDPAVWLRTGIPHRVCAPNALRAMLTAASYYKLYRESQGLIADFVNVICAGCSPSPRQSTAVQIVCFIPGVTNATKNSSWVSFAMLTLARCHWMQLSPINCSNQKRGPTFVL